MAASFRLECISSRNEAIQAWLQLEWVEEGEGFRAVQLLVWSCMNTGEPQAVSGNRMDRRVDLRVLVSLVVEDHLGKSWGKLGCVHLSMRWEEGESGVMLKQIDCLVEGAVLE